MERLIYIASSGNNKRVNGESYKSKDILEFLRQKYNVANSNLDKNKFFETIKFIYFVLKYRKARILICKAPRGGALILKILKFLGVKKSRINLYIYGYGIEGEENRDLSPKNYERTNCLIVETEDVMRQFSTINKQVILLAWPSVKKYYLIAEKEFKPKKTLTLLFFSRIVEEKGVFKIIDAVNEINNKYGDIFTLDIAGSVFDKNAIRRIESIINNNTDITLLGESFTIVDKSSYERFSNYDLHVFLSYFFHECAPGSIIDSFIAGVPTISSKYNSYQTLINEEYAYIVDNLELKTIIDKLMYIYNNQFELHKKRKLCLSEAHKYSGEKFLDFLEEKVFLK